MPKVKSVAKTKPKKYAIPLCPECGGEPAGTVEKLPGVAKLRFDPDGKAHYTGETDINWDGQETMADAGGKTLLECADCCEQYPAPDDFEIG